MLRDGTVLLDLTSDTVTANKVLQGYTAHDASGAAIIGTYTGGGGSGYVESGLIYQNNNVGVNLTSSVETIAETTLTGCTFEICYECSAIQGYGGIIGAALIAFGEQMFLNTQQLGTNSDYGLQVYYGTEYSATALIPINDLSFGTDKHTYTVTQSGTRTNVYFDGSLVGGYDNYGGRTACSGTVISFNNSSYPMTGKCYNIRAYNRALSAAEITSNRAEDVSKYGA